MLRFTVILVAGLLAGVMGPVQAEGSDIPALPKKVAGFPGLVKHDLPLGRCPLDLAVYLEKGQRPVKGFPEGEHEEWLIFKGPLVSGGKVYAFWYQDGPSCDPTFVVRDAQDEWVGELPGEGLVIPGNGFLYLIARSNTYGEQRSKWAFKDGELTEVPQPLYFIGRKTKTLRAVTLFNGPLPTEDSLAELPAGTEVLVVGRREWHPERDDSSAWMVRTPFGLVGWVLDDGAQGEPFKGNIWLGD